MQISFCKNLNRLVDFFINNGERGYRLVKDQMCNILIELLEKTHYGELLEEASRSLAYLSKFLKDEDKEKILRTVILLCQDSVEDNKIVGLQLCDSLADQIGQTNCELFLLPVYLTICEGSTHKLKKTLVLNLKNFAQVISQNAMEERLLLVVEGFYSN